MRIRIRIQPTKINADPDQNHWFFCKFLQKIIRQRFAIIYETTVNKV
jgi:hypothetical protein